MMADDPFGITGRARCVAKTYRRPLVSELGQLILGIAGGEKGLIILVVRSPGIHFGNDDNGNPARDAAKRAFDDAQELPVHQNELRFAMRKAQSDSRRIEPEIQAVEHRARHRDTEMGFDHGGHVGSHDSNRIALADAAPVQRRSQSVCAICEFPICVSLHPVDHCDLVGIGEGRPPQKGNRRKRRIVRGIWLQVLFINIGHGPPRSELGIPA